jgi:hypothetical protein
MKRLRWVTLLTGTALLVLSIALGLFTGHQRASNVRNAQLKADVQVEAARVQSYFMRSESIIRVLSQNPNLAELVKLRSVDESNAVQLAKLQTAVEDDLSYLETLYPGQISESCVILSDGREIVRVTEGVAASDKNLSADESEKYFLRSHVLVKGERGVPIKAIPFSRYEPMGDCQQHIDSRNRKSYACVGSL